MLGSAADVSGEFVIACRANRGGLRWTAVVPNGVCTAACDELNRVMFTGASLTSRTWRLRLIDAAGFTALAAADLLTSHTGWAEFTGYSPLAPVWSQGSIVNGVLDSASNQSVTVTTAGSLMGIYLACGDLLYSTGRLTAAKPVGVGDTLTLRYTVRARPRAGT